MCTWRVWWTGDDKDHVNAIDADTAEEAVQAVRADYEGRTVLLKQVSFLTWCGERSHIGWLPEGWAVEHAELRRPGDDQAP